MKYTTCPYCGFKLKLDNDQAYCYNHNIFVMFDNKREIITFCIFKNHIGYLFNIFENKIELTSLYDIFTTLHPIILPIDNSLTPENSEEKIKTYLSFQ